MNSETPQNVLIKNATILDADSPFHKKNTDLFTEAGIISQIAKNISAPNALVVDGKNIYVSKGWADMRVNFADPGFEQKETIDSGCEAAAYGGFTRVGLLPETQPAIYSKSQVEYILNRNRDLICNILPFASFTNKDGGMAELADMKNSGAFSFTSGYTSVADEGFLMRVLLYAKTLGVRISVFCENKGIAGLGVMNEGIVNVTMGLKGSPAFAEEVELQKIISIVKYTQTPIHISGISTAKGVEILRRAKQEGVNITAEVYIHHLCFDEDDVEGFNTMLKFRPPLRTKQDKESLIAALEEGIIDIVVSNHSPHEDDLKHCEFDLAAYGAIGTQTMFPQLLKIYGEKKLELIVEILTSRVAKVYGLSQNKIAEKSEANFTVFSAQDVWTFDATTNKSKSANSPLWQTEMQGRAIAVIANKKVKHLT